MEPNFKLMLDEMKSMQTALEGSIAAVNLSLGTRIGAVERTISDQFDRLEDATKVFNAWKPTIDESMKELRSKIKAIRMSEEVVEKMREAMMALRKTMSHAALKATPSTVSSVLPPPLVSMVRASSSAGPKVTGPFVGHGIPQHHQGLESKTLSLVKGMNPHLHPLPHPHSLPHPAFALCKSNSSSMLDAGPLATALGLGLPWGAPEPPWEPNPLVISFPK